MNDTMTTPRTRLLLAALRAREWVGPPPERGIPGRRVLVHVGLVEVERVYGPGRLPTTGERMRRGGWEGPARDRWRLSMPWPWGNLILSVAP